MIVFTVFGIFLYLDIRVSCELNTIPAIFALPTRSIVSSTYSRFVTPAFITMTMLSTNRAKTPVSDASLGGAESMTT